MRITLDTNVLVGLENSYESTRLLETYLRAGPDPRVTICVPAVSASENQKEGRLLENFDEFMEFLAGLGLGESEILKPIMYWDVAFWGHALWSDARMKKLEQDIHDILNPNAEFEYSKYCEAKGIEAMGPSLDRNWRNKKCDVLALWSHIWHGCDVFLTDDDNFLKEIKLPRLITLGAKTIARPREIESILANLS